MSRIGTLAARFEILVKTKKSAAEDEKSRNQEIEKVEDELLLLMGENGFQSVNTESGMNLHRKTQKFVSVAEGFSKEELIHELANHACTEDLVSPNYNANSLNARLKEMEADQQPLPGRLQEMIRIIEKDKIGYRS